MYNQIEDLLYCHRDTMVNLHIKITPFVAFSTCFSFIQTDLKIPSLICVASIIFRFPFLYCYIFFSELSGKNRTNLQQSCIPIIHSSRHPLPGCNLQSENTLMVYKRYLFVYSAQITSTHSEKRKLTQTREAHAPANAVLSPCRFPTPIPTLWIPAVLSLINTLTRKNLGAQSEEENTLEKLHTLSYGYTACDT